MSKITYENKVALNQNPSIPDINKVNDTDMNMIKNVVNNNETKVLLAVSSSAPATCDTGDIYFNTTDNLIYTATATNTWGSTGVAPTKNTIYIEFTSQTAYAYDGTTLVSVGGGSGSEIVVGDEEPTEDTKMIIDTDAFDPQYSDITDEYSEASNKAYSCDYVNNILNAQEFSQSIGTLASGGEKVGQTFTITVPSGYKTLGIVGFKMSGAGYTTVNLSYIAISNNTVTYTVANYGSATTGNITLKVDVLLMKSI